MVEPYLPPSADVEESELQFRLLGSKHDSISARCCHYSLSVLLMTDEGIISNMYICLQKYNKNCI